MYSIKNKIASFIKGRLFEFYNKLSHETYATFLTNHFINDTDLGITKKMYCEKKVIVSLTTYGKRINQVHYTIESIFQQTMRANKVILWLDDSFRGQELPYALQMQMNRGLDIRYCKDLFSYKKLIPALKAFPDDIIITIDDDCLYKPHCLDLLITAYLNEPSMIHYNRGHCMRIDDHGDLLPYDQWYWEYSEPNSKYNFPTGVGGVLYPPHCLDDEVFNEEVFLKICKHGDDIWFKAMSLKNNVMSKRTNTPNASGVEFYDSFDVQDVGLHKINVVHKGNDQQIYKVFKKYKLLDLLSK